MKHMGERRLELAWLSKLCRGGPHQAVSRSQVEAAVFWVAITVGAGRQRHAVCNKPQKCNLCFHSSVQLITGLHAKPSALNISRLQLAISKKEEWECVDVGIRLCLSARMKVWVAGRGVEDLYSEGCSCSA